ncbi:MAG: SDR family NAD(P)-dependent oxidoreductase, partial [Dehalococcoidia bacterium]|nr:SDR family NAD(P)-dependent oxidoreductase [Dehalococcoidia bacterium]
MKRLKDRVSIVTGAAAGIGEGIARAMAREGANVIIFGRHDTVKKTAKNISGLGQKAVAFRVDVANASEVNGAVQQVLRQFEKVDILVNN